MLYRKGLCSLDSLNAEWSFGEVLAKIPGDGVGEGEGGAMVGAWGAGVGGGGPYRCCTVIPRMIRH